MLTKYCTQCYGNVATATANHAHPPTHMYSIFIFTHQTNGHVSHPGTPIVDIHFGGRECSTHQIVKLKTARWAGVGERVAATLRKPRVFVGT